MKMPWNSWFSEDVSDDRRSVRPLAEGVIGSASVQSDRADKELTHEASTRGIDGSVSLSAADGEQEIILINGLDDEFIDVALTAPESRKDGRDVSVIADRGGKAYYAGGNINETHYHPALARTRNIRASEIALIEERFVPPSSDEAPGVFSSALQKLVSCGLVVLVGPEGSGRFTSAIKLLRGYADERSPEGGREYKYQRVIPDWDIPEVHQIPAVGMHCYVLDMSESPADVPGEDKATGSEFASGLLALAQRLYSRRAALVILMRDESWLSGYAEETRDFSFSLGRPSAVEVAKRIVSARATEPRIAWLAEPRISSRLTEFTLPREAARIAGIIVESRDFDTALAALDSWNNSLLKWFKDSPQVERRTCLIAAAVLGPSEAMFIRRASDLLLSNLGYVAHDDCQLAGDGLTQQMFNIEAIQTPAGYDIEVGKPHYAEAVIDHVWDEYAGIRQSLIDWLFGIILERDVIATPQRIASVGTGIAIRHGNHGFLPYVAKLAKSNDGKYFDLALGMIDETVLHPVVGGKVRSCLLEWASSDDPSLMRLTAASCGGRFGAERTQQAMTRLSKILSRSDSRLRDPALISLVRLFEQDELRIGVVESVFGWLTGKLPRGRLGSAARTEYKAAGIAAIQALASTKVKFFTINKFFDCIQSSATLERDLAEVLVVLARDAAEDASVLVNVWLNAVDDEIVSADVVARVLTPLLADQLRMTVTHKVLSVGGRPGGIRSSILKSIFTDLSTSKHSGAIDGRSVLQQLEQPGDG
ncbi:hypothetical protein ACLQ22_02875 [Micromonospora sp. DT178]|uniref:hypothetical protein n=1 Tax=Micromonospora sp. DT178 TaxID=3393436 RepID=UPI003CF4BB28